MNNLLEIEENPQNQCVTNKHKYLIDLGLFLFQDTATSSWYLLFEVAKT